LDLERIIGLGILLLVAILVGGWWERRRRRLREEQHHPFLGDSFERLKANPFKLEPLRGKVRKVCVITEEIDQGRNRGSVTSYESFLVTPDDEIVDLQISTDDVMVEENARWLAQELDVPFELS
jgi:hypothetical protein